jgi:hypothetical protein
VSPPLPPSDLSRRKPEILDLAEGSTLARMFTLPRDPIHFDRGSGGRLNAPDGGYGVLYVAAEPRGAFAETLLREPGRTLLPPDLIARKGLVTLRTARPLRLIALMGAGLARVGATAEVTHGGLPYDASRAWSKALRDHPERADGIAYRARHDDDAVCHALFDHAPICVEEVSRQVDLVGADWFWRLMDAYDVGIAPG